MKWNNMNCCLSTGIMMLFLIVSRGESQTMQFVGLRGKIVYDLRIWKGNIYAGTDDGVFVHAITDTDTSWTQFGLSGKRVPALYCSQSPSSGMIELLASVQRESVDTLSPLMYITGRTCALWAPGDRGIDRGDGNRRFASLDGFQVYSSGTELFAVGNGDVFRQTDSVWNNIYSIGFGVTNVVRTNPFTSSVWVGGETGILAPYILRSNDKGKTWIWSTPDLGGDNACYSIAFDPLDTSVVYAGMEGSVIKSTNGGKTWQQSGLRDTPYDMYALASVQTGNRSLLFTGGATPPSQSGIPEYGIFVSRDRGMTWASMNLAGGTKGIRCFASEATSADGCILFAGTMGDGVYMYQENPTVVGPSVRPAVFRLDQNYPNPFNPATSIRYSLDKSSHVKLTILNLLGQKVRTLADADQSAGEYSVQWDATDDEKHPVSSGIYFYRLETGKKTLCRKMHLIR